MPRRFAVRWVTHAEVQRDALPTDARAGLDELLDQLTADPRQASYDPERDEWSATFGPGLLLYTIEDQWATITVLRVLWPG